MLARFPAVAVLLVALLLASAASAGPLFTVDGVKPDRVVVTAHATPPEAPLPDQSMLRELLGVRAVDDTPQSLRLWNAALGRLTRNRPEDTTPVAWVHLIADSGVRTIALVEDARGRRFAVDPETDEHAAVSDRPFRVTAPSACSPRRGDR